MKKLITIITTVFITSTIFAQKLTLKSNVMVTYNVKGTVNQKDSTKIKGVIKGVYWSDNFKKISVDYSYLTSVGVDVETNAYTADSAKIQAIYNIIKTQIPTGLSRTKTEEYELYLGFRYIMAQTFGISVSNIQIVSE